MAHWTKPELKLALALYCQLPMENWAGTISFHDAGLAMHELRY